METQRMAEFGRWQWDDSGFWRDFAEDQQTIMEAAYKGKKQTVELSIHGVGIFIMNLRNMTQAAKSGRGAGFERKIRREVKKISIAYFLLGEDCDMFESNSPVDQITDLATLENLVDRLSKILAEPENFDHRSIDLSQPGNMETIGSSTSAKEFLESKGFQLMERVFMLFLHDEVEPLRPALTEAEAALGRCLKRQEGVGSVPSQLSAQAPSLPNASSSGYPEPPSSPKIDRGSSVVSQRVLEQMELSTAGEFHLCLEFGAEEIDVALSEHCELEELLEAIKAAKPGLRLPHLSVEGKQEDDRPMFGLSAEPGRSLKEFSRLKSNETVIVRDFEAPFVEKFQSGTLTLEEMAMVAPLLDFDKPELMRLLMDRTRMLLEENAPAEEWCKSIGVQMEEERRFGRAIICRLFKDRRLDERVDICKSLLPVEQRVEAVIHVDREDFMKTAMDSLAKLSLKELRGQLNVKFANEQGDDHGGPRRDFFVSLGQRLETDLPGLWRRMGMGPLAPHPDDFSDSTPSSQRSEMKSDVAFRACGRAFALATKYGEVVGEDIAGFFLHQVCRDHVVTLEVLQQELKQCEENNYLASNAILTKSVTESGLKGVRLTRVITGTQKEVELIPGGSNVEITEENKMEWLQLHLQHKLFHCLQRACDAFREGLLDVLGGERNTCPWLALLTPAELADMWAGHAVTEEGVERWRQVAKINSEVQQQADWFWNVLLQSDDTTRGEVLRFCTGAQRFPRAGLKVFEIYPAEGGESALPQAMTCANMLKLPKYSSEDVLKQQLLEAIKHSGDGFHYH